MHWNDDYLLKGEDLDLLNEVIRAAIRKRDGRLSVVRNAKGHWTIKFVDGAPAEVEFKGSTFKEAALLALDWAK